MIDLSQCDKRIIQVGLNNTEVQYILYTQSGRDVVLEEYTESYGQERIDTEMQQLQAELLSWDTIDIGVRKADVQSKIDYLNSVQIEMDRIRVPSQEI